MPKPLRVRGLPAEVAAYLDELGEGDEPDRLGTALFKLMGEVPVIENVSGPYTLPTPAWRCSLFGSLTTTR